MTEIIISNCFKIVIKNIDVKYIGPPLCINFYRTVTESTPIVFNYMCIYHWNIRHNKTSKLRHELQLFYVQYMWCTVSYHFVWLMMIALTILITACSKLCLSSNNYNHNYNKIVILKLKSIIGHSYDIITENKDDLHHHHHHDHHHHHNHHNNYYHHYHGLMTYCLHSTSINQIYLA